MRIRSIKPEFWRSDDISKLSVEDRLLFIGLWSYVDDNGVGVDKLSLVATDLFADDVAKDSETFARVSRGLQELSEGGLIVRYTVDGKDFLEICNWSRHQRIDKPNKARHPASTCDDAIIRESVARVSRDPRESPATGAVEQRNRGTGDKPPTPLRTEVQTRGSAPETKAVTRMHELNSTAVGAAAIEVAKHYTAWAGGGIDSRTRHEIAREVDPLLADGIDPRQIADGIKAWHSSDSWSPTQLRRFVAKAARPQSDTKPTKATLRAVDTMTAAEQIIAEMETA